MCGRFNVIATPGLKTLLGGLGVTATPRDRYNIAPTEAVPLLADGALREARWWLTPSWAPRVAQRYAMFNARSETLEESRAFRGPFRRQRGVVPMSSFLEWRRGAGGKTPWHISSTGRGLAAAALWDLWRGDDEILLSCAIVTTAAAPAFRPWHDRMPVLLTVEECRRWLASGERIAADDPMLAPVLKFPLELAPLAKAVGDARNKNPELMRPLAAAETITP